MIDGNGSHDLAGWMKTGVFAVIGLVIAALLGALAMQLVSQPVGLLSEPPSAGQRLAPAADRRREQARSRAAVGEGDAPRRRQPGTEAMPSDSSASPGRDAGRGEPEGRGRSERAHDRGADIEPETEVDGDVDERDDD